MTLKCKDCGKEFPIAARKEVKKKSQGFPVDEVMLIVYPVCPHCLSINIKEKV